MSNTGTIVELRRINACPEAIKWCEAHGGPFVELWKDCPRGDWLLWLAGTVGIVRELLVAAACDCAALALRFVPDGISAPRNAIDSGRAWCRGEATLEEVRIAANAADAAANAADVAYAAYAAANAAANAAAYAAANAAAYAADAADAAVDAGDAANAAVDGRRGTLRHCAAYARYWIDGEEVERLLDGGGA